MKWWNKLNKWMDWRGISWKDLIMVAVCMAFILGVVSLAVASIFVSV